MSDQHFALSTWSAVPPPTEADYETICGAVMETVRGRWFLSEYAKRHRQTDTDLVLAAIARIEATLRDSSSLDRFRGDLLEMAAAISRTKSEIAAIKPDGQDPGKIGEAREELDPVVRTTAGQRTRKVIQVLDYLEDRINAMIDMWSQAAAAPDQVPAGRPNGNGHDHFDCADIDRVIPPSSPERVAAQQLALAAPDIRIVSAADLHEPEVIASDMPETPAVPAVPVAAAPDMPAPEASSERADLASQRLREDMVAIALKRTSSAAPAPGVSVAGPKPRTMPATMHDDPLAAIAALSEEEKVALFS